MKSSTPRPKTRPAIPSTIAEDGDREPAEGFDPDAPRPATKSGAEIREELIAAGLLRPAKDGEAPQMSGKTDVPNAPPSRDLASMSFAELDKYEEAAAAARAAAGLPPVRSGKKASAESEAAAGSRA